MTRRSVLFGGVVSVAAARAASKPPMNVIVEARGSAAMVVTDQRLKDTARFIFPLMKIFGDVMPVYDSSGRPVMAKMLCLYMDVPENPALSTGSFADADVYGVVLKPGGFGLRMMPGL